MQTRKKNYNLRRNLKKIHTWSTAGWGTWWSVAPRWSCPAPRRLPSDSQTVGSPWWRTRCGRHMSYDVISRQDSVSYLCSKWGIMVYSAVFCLWKVYASRWWYQTVKSHLVGDVGAAELKVNGLLWFLCVDLTHSHHPALLQEQGQRVAVAHVAHPQGCSHSWQHR